MLALHTFLFHNMQCKKTPRFNFDPANHLFYESVDNPREHLASNVSSVGSMHIKDAMPIDGMDWPAEEVISGEGVADPFGCMYELSRKRPGSDYKYKGEFVIECEMQMDYEEKLAKCVEVAKRVKKYRDRYFPVATTATAA